MGKLSPIQICTDISVRSTFTGISAVTFRYAIISDTSALFCMYRAITLRICHMKVSTVFHFKSLMGD